VPETETGVQPRSGVVRQVLVRDAIHEPVDKGNAIDRFCEAPVVDQSVELAFGQAARQLGIESLDCPEVERQRGGVFGPDSRPLQAISAGAAGGSFSNGRKMPIEQWILTDVCSGRSTKNPAFPRSATGTFQAESATRNPWSSSGADADCSPRAAAGFFEVESALQRRRAYCGDCRETDQPRPQPR
jgi:hypothetical protein